MNLHRRLMKLEQMARPHEPLRIVLVSGAGLPDDDEESPEYLSRLEEAKRNAGLESYEGELFIVRLVAPKVEV